MLAQVALFHIQTEGDIGIGISLTRNDITDPVAFLFGVFYEEIIAFLLGGQRFYIRRFGVMMKGSNRFGCMYDSRLGRFGSRGGGRLALRLRLTSAYGFAFRQFIQMVVLNDFNQFRRILFVGGISACFEAMCPSLIVLYRYLKTSGIAGSLEEDSMVFETLRGVFILSETITFSLVIVIIDTSKPIARTLDTEMIVRIFRQLTLPGTRLQQRLRHDDRRRNTVIGLILNGYTLPLGDIVEINLVLFLGAHIQRRCHCGYQKNLFFHMLCF